MQLVKAFVPVDSSAERAVLHFAIEFLRKDLKTPLKINYPSTAQYEQLLINLKK